MTDRTHGGSVLKEGEIELMINRRLRDTDSPRVLDEALDEIDENGKGITVESTYTVQIFNNQLEEPLQRLHQPLLSSPPLYFFTSSFTID